MPLKHFPHPTLRRTRHPCSWAAAAALAIVGIGMSTPVVAGDYPQAYEVIRDAKGHQVGTVQCDGITSQCVRYDNRGRRTGTIDQDSTGNQNRGSMVEEVIEQERRDEGMERRTKIKTPPEA